MTDDRLHLMVKKTMLDFAWLCKHEEKRTFKFIFEQGDGKYATSFYLQDDLTSSIIDKDTTEAETILNDLIRDTIDNINDNNGQGIIDTMYVQRLSEILKAIRKGDTNVIAKDPAEKAKAPGDAV